jgi:hypothetical protein
MSNTVTLDRQFSSNNPLETPPLPPGYFFRIKKVWKEYHNDYRLVVSIQKKGRFFGSKTTITSLLPHMVSSEEIHTAMTNIVRQFVWDQQAKARRLSEERRVDNFVGDYPPKTL